MSSENLVRMANQIAISFRLQPEPEAVSNAMQHIKDYWNPLMRRGIYAHLENGGEGLEPLALKALRKLRETDKV